MKSKLSERSLQTSCQLCQFAIYDNDTRLGTNNSHGKTQTGCHAGRLEQLKKYAVEAYNEGGEEEGFTRPPQEFYVIDCICNMFRRPDWNGGAKDVVLAREEIEPLFSVIIDTESSKAEDIKTTSDSLVDITYTKKKIAVVFSVGVKNTKLRKAITQSFGKLQGAGYRPQIVMSSDKKNRELDAFRRAAGGSYFVKEKAGVEIPSTLFEDIDHALNEDMVRAVVFRREDVNVISLPAYASRGANHETYEEFKSSTCVEAKSMGLYAEI